MNYPANGVGFGPIIKSKLTNNEYQLCLKCGLWLELDKADLGYDLFSFHGDGTCLGLLDHTSRVLQALEFAARVKAGQNLGYVYLRDGDNHDHAWIITSLNL